MQQIKLTTFKRLMLIVLATFVNMVYHTNLSAYTTQAAKNGDCTASTTGWHCKRISSWGESFVQGPVSFYNTEVASQVCLCLSTAEINSANNCKQAVSGGPKPCTTMYTGTSAGYIYYDVVAKSCNGTLGCYCAPGYYAANSTTCSPCSSGYYCIGKGTMVSNVSDVTLATSTACSQGYYQPNTGQSSCNACGSLNGLKATTSGTGKTKVTDCYLPSNSNLTDSIGTYQFTGNCYAIAS